MHPLAHHIKSMSDTQPTAKLYTNIIRTLNTLAEEFCLDDLQTTKLRDTTMEIAKEQFQRGNKGGIRWVYDKLREKGIQVPS